MTSRTFTLTAEQLERLDDVLDFYEEEEYRCLDGIAQQEFQELRQIFDRRDPDV